MPQFIEKFIQSAVHEINFNDANPVLGFYNLSLAQQYLVSLDRDSMAKLKQHGLNEQEFYNKMQAALSQPDSFNQLQQDIDQSARTMLAADGNVSQTIDQYLINEQHC